MPVKTWDSHAVQLLTCCTLMLALLAHPVAPSSHIAMTPAQTPNAAPGPAPATPPVQSPAPAPATPPVQSPATAPAPAPASVTPTNRHIWNVEYILWAPDCKQVGVIGINGSFPGPTITANAGDWIAVEVHNHLHTEGVVIHWHGIEQRGTPWADGTASISQCPINPGDNFTYQFKVDKPGTFFYHGHFGMQRAAGLYGLLIVNVTADKKESIERFKYDDERHMLLSDWYHEAVYAQAAGLERKGKHFQWIGEPQTLLINGKGQFGCTLGDFQTGIHRDAKKCDKMDGEPVEKACYCTVCGSEEKTVEESCIENEDCDRKTGAGKDNCYAKCKMCKDEKDRGKEAETMEDSCVKENGCGSKTEAEKDECDEAKVVCEEEKETNCAKIRRSECGPFCKDTQCGPVVFDVEPGKTYRLRIASTTSLSALNVQVQGHNLTVVEADGNFVVPFNVTDIDIYSGESYSVLLNTTEEKQGNSSYWISVGVIGRHPKTLPALAVLKYTVSTSELPDRVPPATPDWDDVERSKNFTKKLQARAGTAGPPTDVPPRQIVMLNMQDLVDNKTKWAINHVSLSLPATPYLGAYYYDIQDQVFNTTKLPDTFHASYDIEKPPQKQKRDAVVPVTVSNQVYTLKQDEVVDVVLQNADMRKEKVSESHPWHLHGHDFWVLGYGNGSFLDQEKNSKSKPLLNTVNPPLRNTVVVFPHGWTVIRFKADNPGVWAFHCHIEPHLHMGMGVIFAEGMSDVKKLNVPKEAMKCGETAFATMARPLAPAMPPSP